MHRRKTYIVCFGLLIVIACLLGVWGITRGRTPASKAPGTSAKAEHSATGAAPVTGGPVTHIYAHNLRLHQGPAFRIYVRWLRGELVRTKKNQDPTFDDLDSFFLNVTNGVIRANIGDITNYLNDQIKSAPFRDIHLTGSGDQVKLNGTFHKLIPLPVEIDGVIKISDNHRIDLHVTKIDLLKIPLKSILGGLHVTLADLVGKNALKGMQVEKNDIYLDPNQLLPPPYIRGELTKLTLDSPDLEADYGDASKDLQRTEEWRNFLRLRDGTLDFGKLTMHNVDLIMVDTSQDAWFDLDLANYQAQLVNGYTRMTPEAGLQIFMPDSKSINQKMENDISIQWMKNRNITPPADVLPTHKPN